MRNNLESVELAAWLDDRVESLLCKLYRLLRALQIAINDTCKLRIPESQPLLVRYGQNVFGLNHHARQQAKSTQ